MAAVIYRAGVNLITNNGGIQVGQWVFTGRPRVPFYNAEIVHIENFTFSGEDIVGDNRLYTLSDGARAFIALETNDEPDWEIGDVVEARDATNTLYTRISQTIGARTSAVISNIRETGGVTAFNIPRSFENQVLGNQLIVIGGVVYNVNTRGLTNEFVSIHLNASVPVADRPSNGDTVTFLDTFQLEALSRTGVLTGEVTIANVSQIDEGEHFSFEDNGHGNGPLYLTGGTGHYLVVPDGIEITANTLPLLGSNGGILTDTD